MITNTKEDGDQPCSFQEIVMEQRTTADTGPQPSSPSTSPPVHRDRRSLQYGQVDKLLSILGSKMQVHSHNNFPDLNIRLADLIRAVKISCARFNVRVNDVRMNGSAAAFVVCDDPQAPSCPIIQYRDLDLIFGVEIDGEDTLHNIKEAVLTALIDFMPQGTNRDRLVPNHLEVAYVKKMFKTFTADADRWSLLSLHNTAGRNIDLKFVHCMRREYEFTVDSFQIVLDDLVCFLTSDNAPEATPSFFPNAQVFSAYGDMGAAAYHLNHRQICTINPEEIRGGGLLKYCYLLASGYQLAELDDEDHLQQLMCVRFFIDFPSSESQHYKYIKYLSTHCSNTEQCIHFLNILLNVVSRARCIRPFDLQRALGLICNLLNHYCAMAYQSQGLFYIPTTLGSEQGEFAPRQPYLGASHYHHQQQTPVGRLSKSFSGGSGFSRPLSHQHHFQQPQRHRHSISGGYMSRPPHLAQQVVRGDAQGRAAIRNRRRINHHHAGREQCGQYEAQQAVIAGVADDARGARHARRENFVHRVCAHCRAPEVAANAPTSFLKARPRAA